MKQASFTYGRERFDYEVVFVSDRAEKIAIHVHPDASIQVDAPEGEADERIHRAVLKRARWIRNHVQSARERREHALPRTYVSGESHFYLGRRYQLKVLAPNGDGARVRLLRGRICVETERREADVVRKCLYGWYRDRAYEVFSRRLDAVADTIPWLKNHPQIGLRSMRRQWGSCSPSGQVLLNPHLVKAPRDCVDYVITHELCHLREHNHSPRYYRLLGEILPGWESTKAKLDGMAELLLNE